MSRSVSKGSLQRLAEEAERDWSSWNKTYREMTFGEIYREMADYMKELMLIEEKQDEIVIRQAAGKIMGVYPADFSLEGGQNE